MIFDPQYPIFRYPEYVDMRKGHNTLAYIVIQKMDLDIVSGAFFLFVAKNRKACKAIFFDGNGLVLIHKKLESGRFMSVYAKLPRGFSIPTPVGNYNPDWAISFKKGTVKHIYFVAETKGSLSSMELRKMKEDKIKSTEKFFERINVGFGDDKVKYSVIDSFGKLMEMVS